MLLLVFALLTPEAVVIEAVLLRLLETADTKLLLLLLIASFRCKSCVDVGDRGGEQEGREGAGETCRGNLETPTSSCE